MRVSRRMKSRSSVQLRSKRERAGAIVDVSVTRFAFHEKCAAAIGTGKQGHPGCSPGAEGCTSVRASFVTWALRRAASSASEAESRFRIGQSLTTWGHIVDVRRGRADVDVDGDGNGSRTISCASPGRRWRLDMPSRRLRPSSSCSESFTPVSRRPGSAAWVEAGPGRELPAPDIDRQRGGPVMVSGTCRRARRDPLRAARVSSRGLASPRERRGGHTARNATGT